MTADLRRRITHLMLFRVVLITLVFGTTLGLHKASPQELSYPSAIALFAIVAATYVLTVVYAIALPRVANPLWFADAQIAGDLLITTALVHVTGGAESGYVFVFPLSIISAALVRYRTGTMIVAAASIALYVGVAVAGWMRWLPTPEGQRVVPWGLTRWELSRHLVLNAGAFVAVAALVSVLGQQLAFAGERLQKQVAKTADLATLNETIIRCMTSGLVTVDESGKILTFNAAAQEILALGGVEVVGKPLGDVLPEIQGLISELGDREVLRRGEVRVRRDGKGELTLGVSVSPLTLHQGTSIGRVVNFQDLTELRRMEEQMARAQRLAVVGQLAAGVAHEIRNPLASISGSIELLKSAPQVDEDNRALMGIALREVDRLNALVTDLLEYARPRERVPVRLELAGLLEETVRVFSQDRTVEGVKVTLAHAPVTVEADPAQIRQVVWNLLRNAAEAMPEGGEIQVSCRRADRWAELEVADTGVGIAAADLERIFDPFYTTKSRGSGLGLATVHRIVTEHGGTIGVASELGRGSRFTVRLPLAA